MPSGPHASPLLLSVESANGRASLVLHLSGWVAARRTLLMLIAALNVATTMADPCNQRSGLESRIETRNPH